MKAIAIIYLACINLAAFLLMGYDKRCAQRGKWRVSEATLFAAAALFGALGGTLGMFKFRHKTKHWRFCIGFPMLLAIQIAILAWLSAKLL